ncbi:hypothetical protein BOTBODRAFT_168974 [Botryobasidium botryosum FD-172 SS1]|uniref:DDT domain-containing protein n=1 Tax=Botryobasidium botryosum (strain FD-172 SS1) TaxID=930990 RepID=A0A067NCC1_BOTB1|nr:hypothetical protein BOTBODRAFT_168974 [Botryobasidium botryosum FD-172 SS1]
MSTPLRPNAKVVVEIPYSPLWRGNPSNARRGRGATAAHKPSPLAAKTHNSEPAATTTTKPKRKLDEAVNAAAKNAKKARMDKAGATNPKDDGKARKGKASEKENAALEQIIPLDIVKPPVVKRVRRVPEPVWYYIEGEFSREEVEQRIQLREFVLRFEPILEIATTHLQALDEFHVFPDQTAKAVLTGLLDFLAADAPEPQRKTIQGSISQIRSAGMNFGKMHSILQEVCASMSITLPSTPFPSETTRSTRTGTFTVCTSKQLIPSLIALINAAEQTPSLKAEVDLGMKEILPANKENAANVKAETERWAEKRKILGEAKEKLTRGDSADLAAWKEQHRKAETEHKLTLNRLQLKHSRKLQSLQPRFSPLGADVDGNVYYALSYPSKKQLKVPPFEERDSFTRFSWFIFAWGKAGQHGVQGDFRQYWWGFYEVKEIKKLSKWIESRANEVHQEEADPKPGDPSRAEKRVETATPPPSPAEIKALCKRLDEFTIFLELEARGDGAGKNAGGAKARKS